VTVRATEGAAKLMQVQNDPKFRADFWDRVFPRQLPAGQVDVTVVDEPATPFRHHHVDLRSRDRRQLRARCANTRARLTTCAPPDTSVRCSHCL